jgi:hypothetical protein
MWQYFFTEKLSANFLRSRGRPWTRSHWPNSKGTSRRLRTSKNPSAAHGKIRKTTAEIHVKSRLHTAPSKISLSRLRVAPDIFSHLLLLSNMPVKTRSSHLGGGFLCLLCWLSVAFRGQPGSGNCSAGWWLVLFSAALPRISAAI